ncbi:hypothetical protein [Aureimonas sp. SK2]|uniref:hypothetical protein n=1 Tax=Aureimonas sp. SK2 TaxID=3015992 RepID=UPI002444185D|nr:hypothetical protein [Aureimonas sp. SK2]
MSYALNRDIRSFEAAAAIGGYLIVAGTGTGAKIRTAAAATDKIVGVGERVGADAGDFHDATVAGLTEVRAGGAFAAFDPLTSDAQGRAVKAVPVAGQIVRIVGIAHAPALAAGDIVPVQVALSLLSTPA